MKITTDLVKQISDGINSMINEYSAEIEEATEIEGGVAVSLSVKLVEDGPNTNVKLGIGFVRAKVKDEVNFVFSDQQELFED